MPKKHIKQKTTTTTKNCQAPSIIPLQWNQYCVVNSDIMSQKPVIRGWSS